MSYYPVFLNLQGRHCVVIGGGRSAEEKVLGLLEAGAQVTVVATELTMSMAELAEDGRISHVAREYRPGDLAGAFLAISVTRDPATVKPAWQEANELNIPMNTMDDIPHCSFIAPSIVRQGDLVLAISTSGKAPALAVRLRQQLEQLLGPEHARFLELAGGVREPLAAEVSSFEERRERWYHLVDSDVLDLLRQGDEAGARVRIAEIMGVDPEECTT
jgi:precorrin-2 dehydrogenase / sirohydrochlorin ferrochelatase